MTMAAVATTAIDRFTNVIEYTGAKLTALDDWFEIPVHSSSYSMAATVVGAANFKLAIECSFNGNWFTIETAKTINSAGAYVYFYDGKPAAKVRLRISQIDSGEPDVTPYIAAAYHG
jgi:hypothetical protein